MMLCKGVVCTNKLSPKNKTGFCRSCSAKKNAAAGNAASVTRRRLRPYEWLYRAMCREAASVNRKVFLSYDEFVAYTKIKECEYCGYLIQWSEYATNGKIRNKAVWNLDRANSDRHYEVNNVVVCCALCNKVKSNMFTYNQFKKIAPHIRMVLVSTHE